jgi:hypothetical protein
MEKIVIIPRESINLLYTEIIFHTLILLRYEIVIDFDIDEEFSKRVSNYSGYIILTFNNNKVIRFEGQIA